MIQPIISKYFQFLIFEHLPCIRSQIVTDFFALQLSILGFFKYRIFYLTYN